MVPSTAVMPRDGSFALAFFGRMRNVQESAFSLSAGRNSFALKRILEAFFVMSLVHAYILLRERATFQRELQSDARQKFFPGDLSVLDGVNADFGQLPALFRLLVCHISVVLHDESIVPHERFAGLEAMHFHRVDPPIDFAADPFFSARFRRTAAGAVCFHTDDV